MRGQLVYSTDDVCRMTGKSSSRMARSRRTVSRGCFSTSQQSRVRGNLSSVLGVANLQLYSDRFVKRTERFVNIKYAFVVAIDEATCYLF
ncbi:unnamed protein product [Protopolystoma xenopodis]|uniref:Uncharacterized protein n=1 Tax=Protopolystoma xenopodis TaxID=117903 RepID=A0A448WSV8_9PLAT|nr:unnamed protein product [Protopolystoma xenopodis]